MKLREEVRQSTLNVRKAVEFVKESNRELRSDIAEQMKEASFKLAMRVTELDSRLTAQVEEVRETA
jgi:hypothetical protein